ncbi:CBS domain-containing protein [Aliishimia ponticola]|uniref:CBS domain-containing protein n=1 Tax=Aliishimia ponticola TaxID=2499833 RepID=A0A4S4NBP2_9RHOB|nr:CBS domain-containing protein [Aliishimia ponticola]THH36085.1 CBS domain-containing protein [Aliishimia ponticola]
MVIQTIKGILGARPLYWVPPAATLEDACDHISVHRTGALVVLEDGDLHGIITERDILRHASQRGGFGTAKVAQVMTRQVVYIQTNGSIAEASERMQAGGFSHLPVLDMGRKVVGVLSHADIPAGLRRGWAPAMGAPVAA